MQLAQSRIDCERNISYGTTKHRCEMLENSAKKSLCDAFFELRMIRSFFFFRVRSDPGRKRERRRKIFISVRRFRPPPPLFSLKKTEGKKETRVKRGLLLPPSLLYD